MSDTPTTEPTGERAATLDRLRRQIRKRTGIAVVLLLLLLLCQCTEYRTPVAVACAEGTEGASEATLQGLVQGIDDQPTAAASVTLSQNDTVVRNAATDDGGRFSFAGLPPGEYRFEVAAEGFRALEQDLTLEGCLVEAVVTIGTNVSPFVIFVPAPYL